MKSLSLAILLLAGHLLAFATAQSDTNVIAYYTNYDPESKDWDLSAAKVFCASFNGSASLEWRSKYGWTAFCGNNGPQGEEACGKCLNVTNKATGAKETVRIVDTCGSGGLDLDLNTAFLPIDTDGTGFSAGHLTVDYEFVDCDSTPLGPGETDVTAYYTDYKPKENNWDLNAAAVSCATKDGSKSLEWRSKYGWTAFCGSVGPQGEDACGLCLKVINTSTKDEEIVRIVDACGSGGLDLDLETAFTPIDTDGKGFTAGHLTVDYNFVDCGDSNEAKIRVFSQ